MWGFKFVATAGTTTVTVAPACATRTSPPVAGDERRRCRAAGTATRREERARSCHSRDECCPDAWHAGRPEPGRPARHCRRRVRTRVEKANIRATVIVIRSRFFSTTVEPAAACPTEPPNMSDSPPPFPECMRIRKTRRERGKEVDHKDRDRQHWPNLRRATGTTRRYQSADPVMAPGVIPVCPDRRRPTHDCDELDGPQTCSPDEEAVHILAGYELGGRIGGDRAAVEDSDRSGGLLACDLAHHRTHMGAARLGVLRTRGLPVPIAQTGS